MWTSLFATKYKEQVYPFQRLTKLCCHLKIPLHRSLPLHNMALKIMLDQDMVTSGHLVNLSLSSQHHIDSTVKNKEKNNALEKLRQNSADKLQLLTTYAR